MVCHVTFLQTLKTLNGLQRDLKPKAFQDLMTGKDHQVHPNIDVNVLLICPTSVFGFEKSSMTGSQQRLQQRTSVRWNDSLDTTSPLKELNLV